MIGDVRGVVAGGGVAVSYQQVAIAWAGELERDGALDGAGGAVMGLPGAEDLPCVFDRELDAPPRGVPLDELRC